MNLKRNIIILLICAMFAFSSGTFAGDKKAPKKEKLSNSEKAKMILEKAKKSAIGKGNVKSFIAGSVKTSKNLNNISVKTLIFCSFNPDGTMFLYRKDCGVDRNKEVNRVFSDFLINDAGEWVICNSFAIKLNYKRPFTIGIIPKPVSDDNKYSIKSIKDKDKSDAYLITVKMNPNKNDGVAVVQYGILKKYLFPYSVKEYNNKGELLKTEIYEDLKINAPIKDDLFKLSDNVEIKIANNSKDLANFSLLNVKNINIKNNK